MLDSTCADEPLPSPFPHVSYSPCLSSSVPRPLGSRSSRTQYLLLSLLKTLLPFHQLRPQPYSTSDNRQVGPSGNVFLRATIRAMRGCCPAAGAGRARASSRPDRAASQPASQPHRPHRTVLYRPAQKSHVNVGRDRVTDVCSAAAQPPSPLPSPASQRNQNRGQPRNHKRGAGGVISLHFETSKWPATYQTAIRSRPRNDLKLIGITF